MKIALVINAFFDSSLSLYKHLYGNCEIDLYCFVYDKHLTHPAFNISDNPINIKDAIELIPNSYLPAPTLKYLEQSARNIRTFVFKITVTSYLRLTHKVREIVNPEKYNVVHFIGSSMLFDSFLRPKQRSYRVVVSLHEADPYRIKIKKLHPKEILKWFQNKSSFSLINRADYITFFSNNEKDKYLDKFPQSKFKCGIIKFGLFEIFIHYKPHDCEGISPLNNYILYIGLIRPYKGVRFLLETISDSENLSGTDFVIAGKDEIGLNGKTPGNVKIINKFLTENEINHLVVNSRAVILPYTSSSQSGIPSISLMHGKPLIFSDVRGLNEYLTDGYNGIRFKSGDKTSIEMAINKILDPEIYKALIKNIQKNPFPEDLSWRTLAGHYIDLYRKILNED